MQVKREFSAGGVLVHVLDGEPVMAAIRPGGKPEGLWALPKGRIGKGEKPEATAVREVEEETGARGSLVSKLGDLIRFDDVAREQDRAAESELARQGFQFSGDRRAIETRDEQLADLSSKRARRHGL